MRGQWLDAASVYRRLLRVYPRSWRAQQGPALLDALVQEAEARGSNRPSLPEAGALLVGGVRAHLASPGQGPSRTVRERASVLGLASGTAFALVALVMAELPSPTHDLCRTSAHHCQWCRS